MFGMLMRTYGYLGIFLVSLASSATIIFPLPSSFLVFAAGVALNPLLVGVSAGFGAALGEFSGYALGFGGRQVIKRKWKVWIGKTDKLAKKYGIFWIIILFAATPLPDDIPGILAGVVRYPVKKFFLASLIGKLILNLVLAYAGFYGARWILQYLGSGL